MKRLNCKLASATLLCAGILGLASCNNDKKTEAPPAPEPQKQQAGSGNAGEVATGTSSLTLTPGKAGGIAEDTVTASATISAIDASSRKITLTTGDGNKGSFTAGPEVRNFDQLHVGDKVTATITEKLVIFVRSGSEDPSVTHAAELAAAPKGAKPGAMVAESYEIIASVKSIDSDNRTATLLFADQQTKTVKVRSDVDLSQYKVGDTVVIRVTETLSVIVAKP